MRRTASCYNPCYAFVENRLHKTFLDFQFVHVMVDQTFAINVQVANSELKFGTSVRTCVCIPSYLSSMLYLRDAKINDAIDGHNLHNQFNYLCQNTSDNT